MDFRDIKEFIIDSLGYIIFFVTVFMIVFYVLSFSIIVGPSMSPKYQDQDVVLLDKLRYRITKIKRFDIITFRHGEKYYTKRIIGLPGEKIKYLDSKLYVNNKYIKEPFTKAPTGDMQEVFVTSSNYFVLGDNRTDSEDSRHFGLVANQDVLGKVELRLWPLTR